MQVIKVKIAKNGEQYLRDPERKSAWKCSRLSEARVGYSQPKYRSRMALTSSASDVTLVQVCIGTDVDEAMLVCAEIAWVPTKTKADPSRDPRESVGVYEND